VDGAYPARIPRAHIPDAHERMAIHYGWYSTRTPGFRKARCPYALTMPAQPAREADRPPLAFGRTWARLARTSELPGGREGDLRPRTPDSRVPLTQSPSQRFPCSRYPVTEEDQLLIDQLPHRFL
jgi:hypothetical protein